ncbi:MAG: prenyltransferase [Thiomonas sp.]|uniref:tetratricopeptide repeat protein n=1 Tax=Thiomonas sp. TaxID=2047785 RepID=UPI002A3713DF|nr:prenyltransferase [Thiomonas sp.]MDY0330200.1 prenyltransferase [Thiomonas sp.]
MQTLRSKHLIAFFVAFLLALGVAQAATLEQASALLEAGHLTQADHVIAQVLADQPHSAQAHYLDARLLAAEGKWPLAEQELERARRLDPTLRFGPQDQVQALANEVLKHQWKNPSGLAGYGQAALAGLFVLISGYLVFGVMRNRRQPPKA